MDKLYFIKLLHKYLEGNPTIEEQQFVETYYSLFENEPDVIKMLRIEEKEDLKKDIKHAILDNISNHQLQPGKLRFLNKRLLEIAAAAVVIMALGISLFYFVNKPPKEQAKLSMMVYHKENRAIFLPDGSTVILSAGSKLNYPSSFDGLGKREVYLEGQAYFDIKHDASRSFIVYAGKLQTIVLGTAFNIRAVSGEKLITVTVTQGKVKVVDASQKDKVLGVITPNQQITYNKEKVNAVVKMVDSDSLLKWKEQDLLCDNLTIAEAAKLLEDRYKVKITISDQSVTSQRFTTTFPRNDNFEEVLKSICVFNRLKYSYDKEKSLVIISTR